MTTLTTWESVQHMRWPHLGLDKAASDGIATAAGTGGNCFALWPPRYRDQAIASLERGVELGHVAPGFDKATIVGTAKLGADFMELRARWEPKD